MYLCDFSDFKSLPKPSTFHATGRLDVSTAVEEAGTMEWSKFGTGMVVLAGVDTIRNVSLTRHLTQLYVESGDSVQTVESVTYRWYAPGSKIPVAIST